MERHLMERVLKDAKQWVDKAIAFYGSHGKGFALAEFSNPRGRFAEDEQWVYVLDTHGTVLSHPVNEHFEGLDLYRLQDIEGKGFIKEIVDAAEKMDFGWVGYKWYDRPTRMLRPQKVYFKKVDEMIFCSGVYLN